ncbi:MAG: PglZ domain-containing protein, partial [Chloroflexi bacterium]|nr:PglZ domain-containing protein [Chloroflexota bacterium]
AMKDQLAADPERVLADVQKVEDFIKEDPQRLALLMRDQLKLDSPLKAADVLKRERLSGLVRTLALASLLMDLISTRNLAMHQKALAELEKQEQDALIPALRRPTEQWAQLLNAYRRAVRLHEITSLLAKHMKDLKVTSAETLDFAFFDNLWNRDKINRLDFYTSDLDRMLRVGDMLPVPHTQLWPEFEARWANARTEFKDTMQAVDAALKGANLLFQDVYKKNYAGWIRHPNSPVVFTHQFLPRMLKAHWDPKSGRKAVILVFDGLRTDAWDEFVRPVLEERYAVLESRPGSAILPTETQLSRKAISAGMLPIDFPSKNPRELDLLTAWLKNVMRLQIKFEAIKDDDTVASGMTVRYSSPQIDYIVFNFTDDNLHHNSQDLAFIYTSTVREIIRQDVRSVLRELPADALVFITSDHGFTPMPSNSVEIGDDVASDEKNVKYLSVRASGSPDQEIAKRSVQFNAVDFQIPLPASVQRLLFPRPGYYFQRAGGHYEPDRYSHGGLSMAECMIPMVVMAAPKTDTGLLAFESVQQVGSVSEGEPLELEIKIRANKPGETLTIALTFSQVEIPDRKEIFSGSERSYRVQWQPKLGEISPHDRERGYVQMPVTVILTYRKNDQLYRTSRTADIRIKFDSTRVRRRIDSKLDLMMGKLPKELKS